VRVLINYGLDRREVFGTYEKQEILWNVKHPQHYNKLRRYDVWEEVAEEMGVVYP
jgi:hypothetical protein